MSTLYIILGIILCIILSAIVTIFLIPRSILVSRASLFLASLFSKEIRQTQKERKIINNPRELLSKLQKNTYIEDGKEIVFSIKEENGKEILVADKKELSQELQEENKNLMNKINPQQEDKRKIKKNKRKKKQNNPNYTASYTPQEESITEENPADSITPSPGTLEEEDLEGEEEDLGDYTFLEEEEEDLEEEGEEEEGGEDETK